MSRALIGGVVAAVIAVLTASAYFVTAARLESEAKRDLRQQVAKAQELLIQNASLDGLGLLKRVEAVAADEDYVRALKADSRSEASDVATLAFRRFRHGLSAEDPRPDILALTDAEGRMVALLDVARPLPDQWLEDGEPKYTGLRAAIDNGLITSEVIELDNTGLMKVGMAPVRDGPGGEIMGAVVVAYAMSSEEADRQRKLLEADVAYFFQDRLHAVSAQGGSRRAPPRGALEEALDSTGLADKALSDGLADVVSIDVGGESYLATAGRIPRFSSQPLPDDYSEHRAGTMVFKSVSEVTSAFGALTWTIVIVGGVSMVVALLGIVVTARSFIAPIDEIELGINEIINGNIDRTFRPMGSDLDGLANSLNVMLARLLGRPEPGEETYDDYGNIVDTTGGGRLQVETGELSTKDAEEMALAAEAEPDYYKRLFGEYIEARQEVGESVEGISYESFVAKLRLNEANLRARYEARGVRFKVQVKDGKVILKPVPIL